MRAAAPALCSDGRRAAIATAVAVVVPLAVGLATTPDGAGVATGVVLALVGWNLFVVIYVVLTLGTFDSRDPEEFARRMRSRRDLRPRAMRRLTPGGDGPTFAIEAAAVAFAVAVAVDVATTFGATDVNITTPRMRRIVNAHTLLTFVYNSVIVALLASFLTR